MSVTFAASIKRIIFKWAWRHSIILTGKEVQHLVTELIKMGIVAKEDHVHE